MATGFTFNAGAAPISFGAPAAGAAAPAAAAPAAGATAGFTGFGAFGAATGAAATTTPAPAGFAGFSLPAASTTAATTTTAAPATAAGFGGFSLSGAATTTTTAAATTSTTAATTAGLFGATPAAGTTAAAATTSAAPATATPAAGFGAGFSFSTPAATTTTAAATSSSSAAASSSSAAPATAAAAAAAPDISVASSRLRHINVEEMVSLWSRELEDHVHSFVSQAALVQKWDSIMLANFSQIVALQNQVRNVQLAQVKLNSLLETIKSHQHDFNSLLEQLETSIESLPKRSSESTAEELKREEAYQLAEEIDLQLVNMSEQLGHTITSLNSTTEKSFDPSNPLSAVLKILNVHQNSLAWLDSSSNDLQNALQSTQRNVSQLQIQDQSQMRQMRYEYDTQYQGTY